MSNIELKLELERVTAELDALREEQMEPDVELSIVLENLKNIEKEWSEALADINKQREEYRKINQELKDFRDKVMGKPRLLQKVGKRLES